MIRTLMYAFVAATVFAVSAAAQTPEQIKTLKESGHVEQDGVWVKKDHVKDAKRGIYHHDGDIVSKEELKALQSDKVRHPHTGQLIDRGDLKRAESGMYPVGDDWLSEADANKAHSTLESPWVVRSDHAILVGALPIKEMRELAMTADNAIETVRPWFDNTMPKPTSRPVVMLARTSEEYRELGNAFGGAGSAFPAFLGEDTVVIRGVIGGERIIACANLGEKAWRDYNLRHAAGLAYANGLGESASATLPAWFVRGVAAKGSHLYNRQLGNYFAKAILRVGGLHEVDQFFDGFAITGEMSRNDMDRNVIQAGIMLEFAAVGGDQRTTDAMLALTKAVAGRQGKKDVEKAVADVEAALRKAGEKVGDHYKKMVKG